MKKNDYGKGVWFSVYNNLSYELRCYTRISSPKKSRNNTREETRYFLRVLDIANKKWLIEKWFATKENLFGTFSSTIHGSVPAIDSDFELKIICVD